MAGPQSYDAAALQMHQSTTAALEAAWMHDEMKTIDLADLPKTPADFQPWYRARFRDQVAAAESFFDHLAHAASLEELSIYICYEEQVDGRFDDVIALAQLGLQPQAKVALAFNYWEEMGEGRVDQMHTLLFGESATYFRTVLERTSCRRWVQPTAEALANGNLLMFLALRRQYGARLLGALTLLEHTAPRRFSKAVQGMRRLKVPESFIYYHEMHVKVDAKHGDDLLNAVVLPLRHERPDLVPEVSIGVQLRLQVANRYYAMLESVFEHARNEAITA
jgi:hypothetical protein